MPSSKPLPRASGGAPWRGNATTLTGLVLAALVVGCDRNNASAPAMNSSPAIKATDAGSPPKPGNAAAPGTTASKPADDQTQLPTTLADAGFALERQMTAVMATVRIVVPDRSTEGSGVVLNSGKDGCTILTAAHVVEDCARAEVQLFSPTTYPKPSQVLREVPVVRYSARDDLALLRAAHATAKIETLALCPLDQAPTEFPVSVMTLGCGNGKPPVPLLDHVAAAPSIRRPDSQQSVRVWRLQLRQSPGRSGGPMVDKDLRVLGIGSGTSGQHSYYCHLKEIHSFLDAAPRPDETR